MGRIGIVRAMRKYVIQIAVVSVSLVILINVAYLLMTWLSQKVFTIENVYLNSEMQFLGTLIITLVFLLIFFIMIYRRRKRELTTLSEGIERVAKGNYDTMIKYNKRDSMAHVYRNFNKMTTELGNVQFLRKDFINNFSHEFKTPIASINGFASLMIERELPREEQLTYLSIIRDESERLSKLTSNTILLTKISSQEVISDVEEYDLGEQLRQCAIILSPQWLEKKQEFSCDFPKTLYTGNRELMQHLWLNIMGNAVKYTPVRGTIDAKLKVQGSNLVITVHDSGNGIDKKTLAHLFDPYYQGDSSHSEQGLGLGLAIAQKIAELCGGRIEVKSELKKGSEFIITLPK